MPKLKIPDPRRAPRQELALWRARLRSLGFLEISRRSHCRRRIRALERRLEAARA